MWRAHSILFQYNVCLSENSMDITEARLLLLRKRSEIVLKIEVKISMFN